MAGFHNHSKTGGAAAVGAVSFILNGSRSAVSVAILATAFETRKGPPSDITTTIGEIHSRPPSHLTASRLSPVYVIYCPKTSTSLWIGARV